MPGEFQNNHETDEISLRDLFLKIWAVRVPVVATLLIVSMGYWSIWAYKKITAPEVPLTYSMPIHFTFKGVENGKYPNGTDFRLADIISPAVLNRVYIANKLSNLPIDLDSFVASFNIQPYAPEYDLIVAKYKSAIGRNGINSQEIGELQDKMKSELDLVTKNNALVTFAPNTNALGRQVVQDILMDVPKTWAEKAIKEDGVVTLDLTMYSSKIFDEAAFVSLDYLVSFELLADNISLARSNINKLLNEPNGKIVVDDQSGYNLPDLQKALNDTVDYEIKQLVTPVKKLGINKNKETVTLYYKEKIGDLQLRKALYLKKSQVIATVLDNYLKKASVPGLANNDTTMTNPNLYSSSPQLGDAFLDKIMDISEKSGNVRYRQDLSSKIMDYEEKAAEIDYEISKFQEILANIDSGSHKEQPPSRAYYAEEVAKQFPAVLNKLQTYNDITNRIYLKLSQGNLGSAGMLYSHTGQDVMVQGQTKWLTKRDLRMYFLYIFISLSLSLVVFMVRDLFKHRV